MPHRKAEYDANGHEVIVQQVNEGGDVSAWIDGYAAYMSDALDHITDIPLSDKIERHLESGDVWEAYETLLAWMTDSDNYFCQKCNSFYNSEKVVRTHFAGHKCARCANIDKTCDDGGSHDYKCLNPRQKHNARIATKYKCKECGKKKRTTPTG